MRVKLANISGISNNICLDAGVFSKADGDGFDWDAEHRPGVRYKGLSVGLKERDQDPKVHRVGAPDRDLSQDYFLYRIFITPQVFRAYIDDELVIEVPAHGMGKTQHPFQPIIHMSVHGFNLPQGSNDWVNENTLPEIVEPRTPIQRRMAEWKRFWPSKNA